MVPFILYAGSQLDKSTVAILGVAVVYALWRTWRFTIQPALYPDMVKEYPYWIPFIGHAFSFFADNNGTISAARRYFKNSREPYALTIMGETMYIVLRAADASTVWRRTDAFTIDQYMLDLFRQVGITEGALATMWSHRPSPHDGVPKDVPGVANPNGLPLVHLTESMFKTQMHPGDAMSALQDVLLGRIWDVMTWDKMALSSRVVRSSQDGGQSRRISILEWTQFVLMEGATRAFFGGALLDRIDPDLLSSFACFDDQSWKMIYRVPPPWSTQMARAFERVTASFTRYFELPAAERADACWMVRSMASEQAAAGIQPSDIAKNMLLIYWVINGNAWKLAFWLLANLLHRPALLAAAQAECRAAMAATATPAQLALRLEARDACPRTLAAYNEALRTTAASTGMRNVVAPVVVGGKTLRPGNRLMIPFKQMMTDAAIWGTGTKGADGQRGWRGESRDDGAGEEALDFDETRFLGADGADLADPKRNPSWRPFGGGATLCPGRFLARREVLLCVALALARFDLELASEGSAEEAGQGGAGATTPASSAKSAAGKSRVSSAAAPPTFPSVDSRIPCLGIMKPVDGHDVVAVVAPRRVATGGDDHQQL